jgi:hypothetical protein
MDMYVDQPEGVALFNNATQGYCALAKRSVINIFFFGFDLNCSYKYKVSDTKFLVEYEMDTKNDYPYKLSFVDIRLDTVQHLYIKVRRGVHCPLGCIDFKFFSHISENACTFMPSLEPYG